METATARVDIDAPPRVQVAQTIEIIKRSNDPPHLFRRGSATARVRPHKGEPAEIEQLAGDGLFAEVLDLVNFIRIGKKDTITHHFPPEGVMRALRGQGGLPLPVLNGLRHAPFFTAQGELVTAPGYHAGTGIYLAPDASLDGLADVPSRPDKATVERAKKVLHYPIHQFPFRNTASYAHALALEMLPFIRETIAGPVPIVVVKAPEPRTGKGLLIKVLAAPGLGRDLAAMPELTKGEELRKRLTAVVLANEPVVFFDNVNTVIEGGALAAILTEPMWSDRVLGRSELVRLPVRNVWVLAANNPKFSHELLLRTVPIELDANMEQPGRRTFEEPTDPVGYAKAHRAELVWACLVLIQNWVAQAMPEPVLPVRLGGFESFSTVMGGILQAAEIPGFLGNLNAFQIDAGTDADRWRPFVAEWWDRYGEQAASPTALLEIADSTDFNYTTGEEEKDQTERARVIRFGQLLARHVGRVFDIYPNGEAGGAVSLKISLGEYEREGKRKHKGYALRPSVGTTLSARGENGIGDIGDIGEPTESSLFSPNGSGAHRGTGRGDDAR